VSDCMLEEEDSSSSLSSTVLQAQLVELPIYIYITIISESLFLYFRVF